MLEASEPQLPATIIAEREAPWGGGIAVLAVVVAFAIYVIGSVIVDTVWEVAAPGTLSTEGLDIGIAGYQFLVLGTIVSAVTLILLRYHVGPRSLGYRFPGWGTLLNATLVVVPVFAGVALLYFLFSTFLPGYNLHGNTNELLQGTTGRLTVPEKVALFIFAAIEAPITEETLFRGMLYQGLRRLGTRLLPRPAGIGVAALLSGVVFGALHFEPHTFPILAFLGIVLALVFQYSRSIYASMIVHAIVNALAVISLIQTS